MQTKNFKTRGLKVVSSLLGLFLTLAPMASSLSAQGAPAPVGSWKAESLPVTLWVGGDGSCGTNMAGTVVTGTCSWQQTSVGGVLTLHYVTATPSGNFPNNLYYGITWVNQSRIFVRCGDGPNQSGYMVRM
jgi:hypothetical protein